MPTSVAGTTVAGVASVNPDVVAANVLTDSERAGEALRNLERATTSSSPAAEVAAAASAPETLTFEGYVQGGIKQLREGSLPEGWEVVGRGRDGLVVKLPPREGEADVVVKIMADRGAYGPTVESNMLRKLNEIGVSQGVVPISSPGIPGTPDGYLVSEFVPGLTVSKIVGTDITKFNREVEIVLEGKTYLVKPRDLVEKTWRKLADNGYSYSDKWNTDNIMITLENGEPVCKVIDVGGIRKTNINLDDARAVKDFWKSEYELTLANYEAVVPETMARRVKALELQNQGSPSLDRYTPVAPETSLPPYNEPTRIGGNPVEEIIGPPPSLEQVRSQEAVVWALENKGSPSAVSQSLDNLVATMESKGKFISQGNFPQNVNLIRDNADKFDGVIVQMGTGSKVDIFGSMDHITPERVDFLFNYKVPSTGMEGAKLVTYVDDATGTEKIIGITSGNTLHHIDGAQQIYRELGYANDAQKLQRFNVESPPRLRSIGQDTLEPFMGHQLQLNPATKEITVQIGDSGIDDAVRKLQMPPDALLPTRQVTESALVEHQRLVESFLQPLKDAGYKVTVTTKDLTVLPAVPAAP